MSFVDEQLSRLRLIERTHQRSWKSRKFSGKKFVTCKAHEPQKELGLRFMVVCLVVVVKSLGAERRQTTDKLLSAECV